MSNDMKPVERIIDHPSHPERYQVTEFYSPNIMRHIMRDGTTQDIKITKKKFLEEIE